MVARGDEHRHRAAAQRLLHILHRLPAGLRSVKDISRQEHQVAALPEAQVCDFSGELSLLRPQKRPLLLRKAAEGGVQMPVGGMQNFQSHSSTLSAFKQLPVVLSMVNSTASILVGPSAQRYRSGRSPRNLAMDSSGRMPSTESRGPVMPRSVT